MWQLAWWRMYQGPATENMAVLTTSSFCVYPDAFRIQTVARAAQAVGGIPFVGVPRFLILEANVS